MKFYLNRVKIGYFSLFFFLKFFLEMNLARRESIRRDHVVDELLIRGNAMSIYDQIN